MNVLIKHVALFVNSSIYTLDSAPSGLALHISYCVCLPVVIFLYIQMPYRHIIHVILAVSI